jgi:hypothetical protein
MSLVPTRKQTLALTHTQDTCFLTLTCNDAPLLAAKPRCPSTGGNARTIITEMIWTQLVLFGMQNRIFGPYLATTQEPHFSDGCCFDRLSLAPARVSDAALGEDVDPIATPHEPRHSLHDRLVDAAAALYWQDLAVQKELSAQSQAQRGSTGETGITEKKWIQLVPFGIQNRTICSYLAATNRTLISVMWRIGNDRLRGKADRRVHTWR